MSSKKKEYTGKTIDEAIAAACHDLAVSREGLQIEVLTPGSAGIFGLGRKKAVIVVSRKAEATPPPAARQTAADGDQPAAKHRPHGKPLKEREAHQAKPKHSGRREGTPRHDETPEAPPSAEAMAAIQELTQDLLRLMGFPLSVSLSTKGHKVVVHIATEGDAATIIGRDGSTLDALQYLLRKIVAQRFAEKIGLSLDVGNYREDRQKELEELALEMARKVKETGKSQVIGALNPAERRIVHVALQDDTAIRSASIGDGLFKKVRIYLPGKGRKRPPAGANRDETHAHDERPAV